MQRRYVTFLVFASVFFATSNRSFRAHFSFNVAALAPDEKDVTRSGNTTVATVIFAANERSFLELKFFKGKTFLNYEMS